MRHLSRNLILSLAIVPTMTVPATMITSCSTVWGYNTPIKFGSAFVDNKANPFYNFRTSTLLDNNGNNMAGYLQSSYIVDAKSTTNYAYSAPVTKWLYDKDSQEAKDAQSQLMPLDKWERNALGWKTSSSSEYSNNASFTGTLDKDKYVTWVNNENVIQASNIDYTGNIATSLSTYFAGALKYQASQINPSDLDKQEALNIAWGNGAQYTSGVTAPTYTLDNGKKEGTTTEVDKNKLFYEYVFAQSNSFVSHKNHGAFLRGTTVSFNYDTFPYPTYNFDVGTGNRVDISLDTKQLLLGKTNVTADTKFCEVGIDGKGLPAYFSSKTDGKQEITIGDKKEGDKKTPVNVTLEYTDYTFNNVPILITANGLTQRWVNPTKKDSIQPRDYYVDDHDTVKSQVGKLSGIDKYSQHDGDITVKEYTFDTAPKTGTNVQAKVVGSTVSEKPNCVDTRIVDKSGDSKNGNQFIVLGTYVVREFNNDKFIYTDSTKATKTDSFKKILDAWKTVDGTKITTDDELIAWLRQRNLVSLSSTTSVFPVYFLSIYNDLFKQAYVNAKDETIKVHGYILDSTKIENHAAALLGIFNRTSTEGYKSSAKDLTQDSKNLLGFLTYMFGTAESTSIDFQNEVVVTKGF